MTIVQDYIPYQEHSSSIPQGLVGDPGGSTPSHWRPPPNSTFKINVDGSMNTQCATTTLVRNYRGSIV